MFSTFDGSHRSDSVDVIGGADDNGIDVFFFFIEHLAEVFILFRFGISPEGAAGMSPVHLPPGDDVLVTGGLDVAGRPPAGADRSDVEFFTGRRFSGPA